MQSRLILSTLLLLSLVAATAQQTEQNTPAATDALLSSVHSVVIPEHERFTKRIVAPDGRSFVTAVLDAEGDIQHIRVTVGTRTFALKTKGAGAEVLWSPNSRRLAVTYTYCCSGFSPYLHVYEVSEAAVTDLKVERIMTSGFGKGIRCEQGTAARQWALTAAVKWLDSSHLLAAVQVPNVSVCDSMGVFELREISVPNLSIITTYSQLEAKRLFGNDLGGNLRYANDTCIQDPKSCWVERYHPPLQR